MQRQAPEYEQSNPFISGRGLNWEVKDNQAEVQNHQTYIRSQENNLDHTQRDLNTQAEGKKKSLGLNLEPKGLTASNKEPCREIIAGTLSQGNKTIWNRKEGTHRLITPGIGRQQDTTATHQGGEPISEEGRKLDRT